MVLTKHIDYVSPLSEFRQSKCARPFRFREYLKQHGTTRHIWRCHTPTWHERMCGCASNPCVHCRSGPSRAALQGLQLGSESSTVTRGELWSLERLLRREGDTTKHKGPKIERINQPRECCCVVVLRSNGKQFMVDWWSVVDNNRPIMVNDGWWWANDGSWLLMMVKLVKQ